MKILTMRQNTSEWDAERSKGRPTASNASKILTSEGKKSKTWRTYMDSLIAQRRGRVEPPGWKSEAMENGHLQEQESIDAYEFLTGREVTLVGMLISDEICASASPDGLVMGDTITLENDEQIDTIYRGVEAKNVIGSTYIAYERANKVPTTYVPQIHASLAISDGEMDVWDFIVYCPPLPLIIHTVERNAYTETMRQALADFAGQLEKEQPYEQS